MRVKNVPRAEGVIAASPYVEKEPEGYKGRWRERFGNANPIAVEIGMGKGQFIMEMARRNPNINYIGIERQKSVLLRGVEKMEEAPLENVILLLYEADRIEELFGAEEIDRIYLNFSDPWPKDRHAHRRLTSDRFFARYKQFLKHDGVIEFKTDNVGLFEYSLLSGAECGWNTLLCTRDLHNSEYAEGNVMTEYEQKFSQMGNPICKAVFTGVFCDISTI